jgi:hypothetical protein
LHGNNIPPASFGLQALAVACMAYTIQQTWQKLQ